MINELKFDVAHIAASIKSKKEKLFEEKEKDRSERYTETYDRILMLNDLKIKADNERHTVWGGIKCIFIGDQENVDDEIESLQNDLAYIKNDYNRITTEKREVTNNDIASRLRAPIKSVPFVPEWYTEHYVRIISQRM